MSGTGNMTAALAPDLAAGLGAMAIDLAPTVQAQLLDYLALLQKWNKTYNLTAIAEPERQLTHHLLDSLAMLPHVGAGPLLDVGSGAGLPGIPLALARPELRVTLMDASHKKAAFMRQAVIELGLTRRVTVLHGRVEALQTGPFAQITARAFADLNDFTRLTAHLLAEGGEWLAMKGVYPADEIAQLKGVVVTADFPLTVPGLSAQRHLLVLRPDDVHDTNSEGA
jgi:16S rRNA (guanine527-N7)-methyltransferase